MTRVKATSAPVSFTSNNGQSSVPTRMLPRSPVNVIVAPMGDAEPGLDCCAVHTPSKRRLAVAFVIAGRAGGAGGGAAALGAGVGAGDWGAGCCGGGAG